MSGTHAVFSPSGSEKRYLCPASFALEHGLPDTENEYSIEGTAAHRLAELMLRCHLSGNDGADVHELECFLKELPEKWADMPDQVQKYVDALLTYAGSHTLMIEQTLNYAEFVGVEREEAWGTGDGLIITSDGEELQLHDFKYGMGVRVFASYEITTVDVTRLDSSRPPTRRRGNRQLMNYALGALSEYGMLGNFKRVRLVIHQPRLDHLDEWDCTIEDLMRFAKEEAHAILQCKNALTIHKSTGLEATSSYFNPSETACRWCKAAATCPALSALVEREMLDEMDELQPVPTSPGELGRKLDLAPLFEHYVKAVRAESEKQAFAGTPPIGKDGPYKLVRGKKGNRAWQDESDAEKLLKSFKLKRDEMYVSKLITPTAAESLLKKAQPRRWAKAQALITQSEGGISIAPATDKREAYIPTPSNDEFSDIEAEELAT